LNVFGESQAALDETTSDAIDKLQEADMIPELGEPWSVTANCAVTESLVST
jgi:hypothetical protein